MILFDFNSLFVFFRQENLLTSIIYIVSPDYISKGLSRFLMRDSYIFDIYKCHLWFGKFFHMLLHTSVLWSHLSLRIIIFWIYLKILDLSHLWNKVEISLWKQKKLFFTNGKITCKSRSRISKIIIWSSKLIYSEHLSVLIQSKFYYHTLNYEYYIFIFSFLISILHFQFLKHTMN